MIAEHLLDGRGTSSEAGDNPLIRQCAAQSQNFFLGHTVEEAPSAVVVTALGYTPHLEDPRWMRNEPLDMND